MLLNVSLLSAKEFCMQNTLAASDFSIEWNHNENDKFSLDYRTEELVAEWAGRLFSITAK